MRRLLGFRALDVMQREDLPLGLVPHHSLYSFGRMPGVGLDR